MKERVDYSVRGRDGSTCGHAHKTPEAAKRRCWARMSKRKGDPGRAWGVVRYVDGIES
jgi:hypothetical protein